MPLSEGAKVGVAGAVVLPLFQASIIHKQFENRNSCHILYVLMYLMALGISTLRYLSDRFMQSTNMMTEITQPMKIPISNFCHFDVTTREENLP